MALAACTPKVVKETVVVEKEKVVEKVVTEAPAPKGKTVIKFMQGFQPGENEYPFFEWARTEYNARQQAVEVTHMDSPRTDMMTVFQTMSARGDPPDLLIAGPINSAMARSGVLRSLDEFVDTPINYGKDPNTAWFKVYNQALIEMQKVDGKHYGVPCEGAYTFVIYYNQDFFEKHKTTPPKTWTELIKVADVYKAAGIAPFTLAGVWPYYMHWWFFTLAQRTAGTDALVAAMFKDKATSWNQPDFLLAAQEIQKLRDGKYFVDGFQGMDHIASHMEFLSSRAAMDFVGTWFPGEMGGSIPADFKYASFSFPAYEGGKGDPTFAQLWANNIYNTSTKYIPEAIDYLKWWSSDIVQDQQAEMLGTVSARAGAKCPPVQTGACDQVANAKGVAGYEFDIYGFDNKLESAYQKAAVEFFFGTTDAKGYVEGLDAAKQAYFKAKEG